MSLRVSQLRSGRSRYGRSSMRRSFGRTKRYGRRSYGKSRYRSGRRRRSGLVSMYSDKKKCFVAMKYKMKKAIYRLAKRVVKNVWLSKHDSTERIPKDKYKKNVKDTAHMLLDYDVIAKMRKAKSSEYYNTVHNMIHAGVNGSSGTTGVAKDSTGSGSSSSLGMDLEKTGEQLGGTELSNVTGGLITPGQGASVIHSGLHFMTGLLGH